MPENTPAAPLPPCPFVAGPMIREPRLFVGREVELRFLARQLAGAQPTSVNVVGERRIGKSSLLYHFYQTWAQRAPGPPAAVVVYLSLQDAQAQTEPALYRAMLSPLLGQPAARRQATLRQALETGQTGREGFAAALRQCCRAGLLPVFCLDEFEAVLERPERFDDGFYDAGLARGLQPTDAAPDVLRALVRRELVEATGEGYRFQVPLIRRWVADNT